jgi:hypothetical protein
MAMKMKYATLLLGLAILAASVVVAAAREGRTFECEQGVAFFIADDGLVTIYPPSQRRYIRLNNIRLDMKRREVTMNGKLCQEGG